MNNLLQNQSLTPKALREQNYGEKIYEDSWFLISQNNMKQGESFFYMAQTCFS